MNLRRMLVRTARHLTYANVVATLALFAALTGSAYAAIVITGANVRNGSLTGADIRNSSLTGIDVRNGSLGVADMSGAAREALAGADGADGSNGTDGATGPQGPAGAAGAAGLNGAVDGGQAFGSETSAAICTPIEVARVPITTTTSTWMHVDVNWSAELSTNSGDHFYQASTLLLPRSGVLGVATAFDTTDEHLEPQIATNAVDGDSHVNQSYSGLIGDPETPIPAGSWDLVTTIEVGNGCTPATTNVQSFQKVTYMLFRP